MKIKRIILILILVAAGAGVFAWQKGFLIGLGVDKEVKEEAQNIVQIVEKKDMQSLDTLLFGTNELAADEELADFFTSDSSEANDSGVIAKIVERDSLKVTEITEKEIVYEVNVPDLGDMLQDAMKQENLTQDNFEDYIYDYIASADQKKIKVEVPYTYENGVFTADYANEEFVDAITGNMMSSYQKLVQKMISDNSEEDAE